jgi:transglutaminase-like putative cysteine protease
MSIIKKAIILLIKKTIQETYKQTSPIIIYSFLLIIAIISENCFKIKGFNYISFTLLFLAGVLSYKLQEKIGKKSFKIIFIFMILAFYYLFGRYNLRLHSEQYELKMLYEINNLIYNSLDLNYTLLFPYLYLLLPLITVVFIYLDKAGKGYFLVLCVFLFMVDIWINGFDKKVKIEMLVLLFISILYYTLIKYKNSEISSAEKKMIFSVDRKSIFTYGIIMSFCTLLIAAAAVKITGIYNLKEILSKIESKSFKITDDAKNNIYGIGFSGYESSKLGGPITLENGIAFRVKSEKPHYLRGSVKDYYDGFSWQNSSEGLYKKGNEDIFTPSKEYKDLVKSIKQRMVIYPEELKTSTIFTTYNTFNIKVGGDPTAFTEALTFLLLNKAYPTTYYTVDFYDSEIGVENFMKINNPDFTLDYEVLGKDKREIENYDKNIRAPLGKYLFVPENVSPQIKGLVKSIIGDSKNTNEIIHSIYEYLKNNYKYSMEVSTVPEGKEFIEHFLFSEKKGYCTYFATAAVIFCRIAGIPARYVEGFNMKDLKDSRGIYIVNHSSAHAWCEILTSKEQNTWSVLDCTPEALDTGMRDNYTTNDSAWEAQWGEENADEEVYTYVSTLESNNLYEIHMQESTKKLSLMVILKSFIYTLPYILVLSSISYISFRVYLHKAEKMKVIKSLNIGPVYFYAKKRLIALGLLYKSSQTEFEYVNTISESVLKNTLSQLVEIYIQECFGNKRIIKFDNSNFYDFIEKYIRGRQNIFKYLWYKYFTKYSLYNINS